MNFKRAKDLVCKTIVEFLDGYYPPTNPHDVLTQRVAHLFSTVTDEDIIKVEGLAWYIGGRELTNEEKAQLKAEARSLQNMLLWDYLCKEVHYHAYKKGYLEATKEFDLIGGKMLMYTLDIIKTKIKKIGT
ncbi:MAG: hypothetical protein NUW00_01225 [Candidatus Kaiserbacteria bacterium]|nr:hypothetical protein [Candidatus Kaiserbacteria bacterium]